MLVALVAGFCSVVLQPIDARPRQREVTDLEAHGLVEGLEIYRLDNGRYPSTSEGLEALTRPLPDDTPAMLVVPYDGWGSAFVYVGPDRTGAGRFFLVSPGPDNKSGTPDDLSYGSSATPDDDRLATDGVAQLNATTVDVAARCVKGAFAGTNHRDCVVPSFREGKPRGAKLFCAGPRDLLHKLGFRDADVVTSVAGIPVGAGSADALVALARRPPPAVAVDLERGGKPMRLTIRQVDIDSSCRAFW